MSDDGFLSRWSRRKAELRQGVAPPAPVVDAPPEPPPPVPASPPAAVGEAVVETPTLEDVAQLTRDSSYARFVTRDVPLVVKNAAMKKLFTDPHFNVMDGLDTYIDDYGIPDPIPEAMLRRMTQSKFLGLFDHEEDDAAPAVPSLPADVATNPNTLDEDADLRLQQDDAARRPGTEPGADPGDRR